MEAYIEEAKTRGCQTILIGTISFKAREFYEKFDFEVFGDADGYRHGFVKHHMIKRL